MGEQDSVAAQKGRVRIWTSPTDEQLSRAQDQPELTLTYADQSPWERAITSIGDLDVGVEYRLAPLLAVVVLPEEAAAKYKEATAVVVGHTHVCVDQEGVVSLRAVIGQMSTGPKRDVGDKSGVWRATSSSDPRLLDALRLEWEKNDHDPPVTAQARATRAAKALAENSRNAVARLRESRYEVERRFGLHLRRQPGQDMELVLADVVELLAIVGRARDVARWCVRSGLQYSVNNPTMYHAQRRLVDPSLPPREGREAAEADPTFAEYDAAVRQCRALEQELSDEIDALRAVLASGSAIAVTRDAQAQEKFTILATVSAVALGLPALVLALYGASAFLPLNGALAFGSFRLLYPVLAAGVLAAVLAASLPGKGRRRWRFIGTLAGVLVVFLLLAVAGRYGPPPAKSDAPAAPATPPLPQSDAPTAPATPSPTPAP